MWRRRRVGGGGGWAPASGGGRGIGAAVGGGMELMAVPKKKVSKYKKGLRNGPKVLKPVPVIVRCRCCGRVKLPHFYCCSGERGNPGDSSS
uniref:Large ribosomal subunit protein bL32m n=1 Tax=Oryza brachyantha TaxID=4533 RepID=J3LKE8_ORYBR